MFYIPKLDYYLKILTDEEINDFVAINSRKKLKTIKGEQNRRRVAKFLYIFLTTPNEVATD